MSKHSKNIPPWADYEKQWFVDECGVSKDPDEWEAHGFSSSEAIEWALWDVEPGDANRYRKSGTLNPPDMSFSYNGIAIKDAIQWVKEGFDLVEAVSWYLWKVDPKTAVRHRKSGLFEAPDEQFRHAGLTLEETLKWFDEGFEDFDDAMDWIKWKVSPTNAKKYTDAGGYSPDDEFYEAGLCFADAIKWCELGFEISKYEDPLDEDENCWKNWHDAGFKPNEAASLRAELFEVIEKQFDELYPRQTRIRHWSGKNGKESELSDIASECVSTLTQLAASGMKIDAENLVKWRGFSADMITATVDNGLEPDDAELALKLKIQPQYNK